MTTEDNHRSFRACVLENSADRVIKGNVNIFDRIAECVRVLTNVTRMLGIMEMPTLMADIVAFMKHRHEKVPRPLLEAMN